MTPHVSEIKSKIKEAKGKNWHRPEFVITPNGFKVRVLKKKEKK